MVESKANTQKFGDAYIVLGFKEEPKNSLLTMAEFTPSKFGGKPAWISPEGIPDVKNCERCGTRLCFVAQLYANLDHLQDSHRMLYLFACVSDKCINRPDTFTAYRCIIKDDNPHISFATDQDYNEILKKSDDTLMTTKYY